MNKYAENLNHYQFLNKTAKTNAAVFFGADWLSKLPIAEYIRDSGIESAVYNRSLAGLVLDDAEQVLEDCVYALLPDKVFINLGENDIKNPDFNDSRFMEKFEWLLYAIHSRCNCNIYILSVINDYQNQVNHILKKIAEKYECEYIDISSCRSSAFKFFSKIRFFLRRSPISFYEAFHV